MVKTLIVALVAGLVAADSLMMESLGKRDVLGVGEVDLMKRLAMPRGRGRRGRGRSRNSRNDDNDNDGDNNDDNNDNNDNNDDNNNNDGQLNIDDIEDQDFEQVCKDIEFCQGKEIETENLANAAGRCVPIMQGELPPFEKLATMFMTRPMALEVFDLNDGVVPVEVQTSAYEVVNFDQRPLVPQSLNDNQELPVDIRFCTVQILGEDPGNSNFMGCVQGQPGDGGSGASAQIDNITEPGLYQTCGMPATQSGACPIMPKAQRSAEHDCRYYIVKPDGVDGEDIELPGIFGNCQVSNGQNSCPGLNNQDDNNQDDQQQEEEDPDQEQGDDNQDGNQEEQNNDNQ